ncbi:type II toxin-antitoxin system VapC family toxin, partial [Candidatus Bathyarchaeota archaeon]|nr:type II toxin-antitoxin system VapC family toxin [Candidatus Bathyarchaeota archaeon]
MLTEIAIDASTIVALYTPEEHSEWVRRVLGGHVKFHILDLTPYEVINALWVKTCVLKELSEGEFKETAREVWKFIDKLCLIHSHKEVRERSLNISIKYALTIYDSSYIALAQNLNMKLATTDVKLFEKLKETPLY